MESLSLLTFGIVYVNVKPVKPAQLQEWPWVLLVDLAAIVHFASY